MQKKLVIISILLILIIFLGFKYFVINKEFHQNIASIDGNSKNIEKKLFNGTGQSLMIKGGTQAYGGVDDLNFDWNSGQKLPPPLDTYVCPLGWVKCTRTNNYCGTGLSSADAKDNCTNLIWSLPCNELGCVNFSEATSTYYSWDSSNPNNNSLTAPRLCSSGFHKQPGWFLPHQKQLMQTYINGSYGNLIPYGVMAPYWSATTNSWHKFKAWVVDLSTGASYPEVGEKDKYQIRCVRPTNTM